MKSPKCSAQGKTVPVRLLQEALVVLVFKQISQFGSFGKNVYTLCLPNQVPLLLAAPLAIHEMTWKCLDFHALDFSKALLKYFHQPKFFLNSCSQSGNSCDISLCTSSRSSFLLFSVFCGFMQRVPKLKALHTYVHSFLVLDFRCIC